MKNKFLFGSSLIVLIVIVVLVYTSKEDKVVHPAPSFVEIPKNSCSDHIKKYCSKVMSKAEKRECVFSNYKMLSGSCLLQTDDGIKKMLDTVKKCSTSNKTHSCINYNKLLSTNRLEWREAIVRFSCRNDELYFCKNTLGAKKFDCLQNKLDKISSSCTDALIITEVLK